MNATCYTTFLEQCRPYDLPKHWAGVASDSGAFLTPDNASNALANLRSQHADEQLLETGLVKTLADGRVVLHDFFKHNAPILPIRDGQSGQLCNLVTDLGCVAGQQKPFVAMLRDQHTLDAINGPTRAFLLTDSLSDAILLRTLGLPAAPVVGLANANSDEIAALSQFFEIKRTKTDREHYESEVHAEFRDEHELDFIESHMASGGVGQGDQTTVESIGQAPTLLPGNGLTDDEAKDPIRMTFVNWSPSLVSLTEPVRVQAAIHFLGQLCEFRGLQIYDIYRWSPSPQMWKAIEFALSQCEGQWLKDALLDSHFSDCKSLASPTCTAIATAPTTLVGSIELLHEVFRDDPNRDASRQRRKEALLIYQQRMQLDVVSPLLAEAQMAVDPYDRALITQFAQLTGLFSEKMAAVREKLAHDNAGDSGGKTGQGDKSITELLSISSQLVSLLKETPRWKRSNRTVPKNSARPLTIDVPRFEN